MPEPSSNQMSKRHSPLGRPAEFSAALIDWFAGEGKDYPWRRTRDPYAVLVSELMLQQTQIATVLARCYFENWMEQFPTLATLASAPEEAVLKAWEGLGYYRRARNLQKAAVAIAGEHGGEQRFTVVTEYQGELTGRRVVRGRELETRLYYG